MAKKNFKTGIDGLLQQSNLQPNKIEGTENVDVDKKQIKATYYYYKSTLDNIKAIAYYDRKPIGEVINEALVKYINDYSELDKALKLKK